MSTDGILLEVRDLSVRIGAKDILQHISFSVSEGEWLMIAGPNGAGKSTIVNAVSQGIHYDGQILWKGEDLKGIRPHLLSRRLGVLTQNHAVGYAFTVEEVVRLGRYAWSPNFFKGKSADDEDRVDRALSDTGLTGLRTQNVLTLSGGELQRVFLAQLFAQDPELLILDEPTNHLDMVYQKQIFELLKEWLKKPGRAIISVVHDLSFALACGTSALLMDQGTEKGFGPVREVLNDDNLLQVYGMDVGAWMRGLLSEWT